MSHAAVKSPRSKDAVVCVSCFLVSINSASAKKIQKERLITVQDSEI